MPTFFVRAYRTSSGIQLALQPASTRLYSQRIDAAKSTYRFCSARLRLLGPLDHHDQVPRPALIQEVSVSLVGAARSVIRSLSVTPARSPTTSVRHGVGSGPVLVVRASGNVTRKVRLVAS